MTTTTILDHIDGITVIGNPFAAPANEYWALVCMRSGMQSLYQLASRADREVKQRVDPDDKLNYVLAGRDPAFAGIPMPLLTCAFHWYAISACQYVRTVGAIAYRLDSSRPLPQDYAKGIIPEVVAFRNKVAAHFAWSTANERDNDAERLASILPPLDFHNGTFKVGGLTVNMTRGGSSCSSDAIQPWSLCKVHEELTRRYWPPDLSPAIPDSEA